jgi:hypothetical protein
MKAIEYLNSSESIRHVADLTYSEGGKILLDVIQSKKEQALKDSMMSASKGQNLKALRLLTVANSCNDILKFINEATNKIQEVDE